MQSKPKEKNIWEGRLLFKGKYASNNRFILRTLALRGPLTIWELAKIKLGEGATSGEIRSEASIIFRRIKGSRSREGRYPGLEELGYVQQVSTRASKGVEVPLYNLTFEGLLTILQHEEDLWNQIDRIVEAQKDLLPEYFELWGTFKRNRVEDIAVKLLRKAVEILSKGKPNFPERIDGCEPTLRDWFVRMAIYPPEPDLLTREELRRWWLNLLDDRFYNLVIGVIEWMLEAHKRGVEIWSQAREAVRKAKMGWEILGNQRISDLSDFYGLLNSLKQNTHLWRKLKEICGVEDDIELKKKIVECMQEFLIESGYGEHYVE
jgi:hypothetical protein